MTQLEKLELQLQTLRNKWKVWPRSPYEPGYWKFRADRAIALRIKSQIELLQSAPDKPLDNDQLEAAVDLHFK